MDDVSTAPTCERWITLLKKMQKEKTPFTLKNLAVSGKDILENVDVEQKLLSLLLQQLLFHVATHPSENEKQRLLQLAKSFSNTIKSENP